MMSRIRIWLTGLIVSFLATTVCASDLNTPVGYWKTIDDVTGKPKSIVQIWKTDSNILMGKVVKVFPNKAEGGKLCTACSGDNHNKPIVGLVVLSGLKSNQTLWGHGNILDPENGKTYNCSLRVADNGKKLNVHGYIGIPLLGRSQIWERIDLM